MDKTEELELISTIKNAPDSPEATRALELLYQAHRPFIKKVAKSYATGRRKQNLRDLVQAGAVGYTVALHRAAKSFDPTRGRLWSYVKHDVDGEIRAAAVDLGNPAGFVMPEKSVRGGLVKMREATERLARDGNGNPTKDEVAAEMKVAPWKVDLLVGISSNVAYLESPPAIQSASADYDPDADLPDSLHEMVPDDQRIGGWSAPWPTAEEHAEQGEQRTQIERLLGVLDPRQRDVVILYYGLNGGAAMSATQIGRHLVKRRISKQAVMKIVKAALARMRAEADVPEERKHRFVPTEDAIRAFARRRFETETRGLRMPDEFDIENHNYMKEVVAQCRTIDAVEPRCPR